MTITIECEWDQDELALAQVCIQDIHHDDRVPWDDLKLYNSAKPLLKEVARWKIEQNKKET